MTFALFPAYRFQIDPRAILVELGQRKAVAGKALSKKERLVKDETVARLDVSCN